MCRCLCSCGRAACIVVCARYTLCGVVLRKAVVHAWYCIVYWCCSCAAHDWVLCYTVYAWILHFFTFAWSCCYNLIYANVCQCCLFNLYVVNWHAKCVPREPISRSSASQTADGILRCGLSVSILHAFPCAGRDPEVCNVCSVCTVCVQCVQCVQCVCSAFFFTLLYFPHAPLHCIILHVGETISCII